MARTIKSRSSSSRSKKKSWVRNAGSSVGNAFKITAKEVLPSTYNTAQGISEINKEIRNTSRKFKNVQTQEQREMGKNKLAKAARDTFNRAKEQLNSGVFSNIVSDELYDSFENDIMGDFDLNDDFALDDDEFSDSTNNSKNAEVYMNASAGVAKSIVLSSSAQVKGMEHLANSINRTNAKLSSANADAIINSVLYGTNLLNSSLMTLNHKVDRINDNIEKLLEFHNSNTVQAYETMGDFFSSANDMMSGIGDMLENMTKYKYSKDKPSSKNFDTSSGFNVKEYLGYVKNNFGNSLLGTMAQLMLPGQGMGGGDTIKKIKNDPVGFIAEKFIGMAMPKSLKKFDEKIGKYADEILKRIGSYSPKGLGFGGQMIWSLLGISDIFGNDRNKLKGLSLSGYTKDALPWNGYAQRAIVEVIPEYLSSMDNNIANISKILSKSNLNVDPNGFNRVSYSKGNKRYYDYETGMFKTKDRIEKDFNDELKYSLNNMAESITDAINGVGDKKQRKKVSSRVSEITNDRIFDNIDDKQARIEFAKAISYLKKENYNLYKQAIMDYDNYINESIAGLNEKLFDIGSSDTSIFRNINNQYGKTAWNDRRNNIKFKRTDERGRRKFDINHFEYAFMDSSLIDERILNYMREMGITDDIIEDIASEPGFYKEIQKVADKATSINEQKTECKKIIKKYYQEWIVKNTHLGEKIVGKFSPKRAEAMRKKRMNKYARSKFVDPVDDRLFRTVYGINKDLEDDFDYKHYRPVRSADDFDFDDLDYNTYSVGTKRSVKFSGNKAALRNRMRNRRARHSNDTDDIRAQVEKMDITGNPKDILGRDQRKVAQDTALRNNLVNRLQDAPTPNTPEEALMQNANANTIAISNLSASFTNFTSSLFGENGLLSKFWDSEPSKKLREKIKKYFFDEKDGIFKDQVKKAKDGKKSFWKKTKEELGKGYDKIQRGTMTYLFGEDWQNNETYLKYLSWTDRHRKDKRNKVYQMENDPRKVQLAEGVTKESLKRKLRKPGDRKSTVNITSNLTDDVEDKKYINATETKLLEGPKRNYKRFTGKKLIGAKKRFTVGVDNSADMIESAKDQFALTIYNGAEKIEDAAEDVAEDIKGSNDSTKKKKVTQNIFEKFKESAKKIAPKAAAAAIAGGIFGLLATRQNLGLTGLAFLPHTVLGGAIAAAGLSILSHTEAFQSVMFGKMDDNGERHGGIFTKKMQASFKKALPFAIGGATLGVIKSIVLPSTVSQFGAGGVLTSALLPSGVIGGALLGAALGILKNNESFQSMLFGEKGADGKRSGTWLSNHWNKSKERLGKLFPMIGKGIKGFAIGALTATTMSHMGFIPAALSAGGPIGMGIAGMVIGMSSASKKFNEYLFGTEQVDENGNVIGRKTNGLLRRMANVMKVTIIDNIIGPAKEHVMGTLNTIRKNITIPFRKAFGPIVDSIKEVKDNIVDNIKAVIEKIGDGAKTIIEGALHRIFGPVASLTKLITKAVTKTASLGIYGAVAPVSIGLRGLELLTRGKRKDAMGDYRKEYRRNIATMLMGKWRTEREAGNSRTGLGKAVDIFQAIRGKGDIARAAKEGWADQMSDLGRNAFDWMTADNDLDDLNAKAKAAKKENKMWKKVNKIRENITIKDLGGREVDLTDEQVKRYREMFRKAGMKDDKYLNRLQTSDDIMDLLYRRGEWSKAVKNGTLEEQIMRDGVKVQESPEEKAARERTMRYQTAVEDYLQSIRDFFAGKALNSHLKINEFTSEADRTEYADRILKKLKRHGIDTSGMGIEDIGNLSADILDDDLFNEYRESGYFATGNFRDFVKQRKRKDENEKKRFRYNSKKNQFEADKNKYEAMREEYVRKYGDIRRKATRMNVGFNDDAMYSRVGINKDKFLDKLIKAAYAGDVDLSGFTFGGRTSEDASNASVIENLKRVKKSGKIDKGLGPEGINGLADFVESKIKDNDDTKSSYLQKIIDLFRETNELAGLNHKLQEEQINLAKENENLQKEANKINQDIADAAAVDVEINTDGDITGDDVRKKRKSTSKGNPLKRFGKRIMDKYKITENENVQNMKNNIKSFFALNRKDEDTEEVRKGATSVATIGATSAAKTNEEEEKPTENDTSIIRKALGKILGVSGSVLGAVGNTLPAKLVVAGVKKIIPAYTVAGITIGIAEIIRPGFQARLEAKTQEFSNFIERGAIWDQYVLPTLEHGLTSIGNGINKFSENFPMYWNQYIFPSITKVFENIGKNAHYIADVIKVMFNTLAEPMMNAFISVIPTIAGSVLKALWNVTVGKLVPGWKFKTDTTEVYTLSTAHMSKEQRASMIQGLQANGNNVIDVDEDGTISYTRDQDAIGIDEDGNATYAEHTDAQRIGLNGFVRGAINAARGGRTGRLLYKGAGAVLGATVGGAFGLMPGGISPVTGALYGGARGAALGDAAIKATSSVARSVAGSSINTIVSSTGLRSGRASDIGARVLQNGALNNISDKTLDEVNKVLVSNIDDKQAYDILKGISAESAAGNVKSGAGAMVAKGLSVHKAPEELLEEVLKYLPVEERLGVLEKYASESVSKSIVDIARRNIIKDTALDLGFTMSKSEAGAIAEATAKAAAGEATTDFEKDILKKSTQSVVETGASDAVKESRKGLIRKAFGLVEKGISAIAKNKVVLKVLGKIMKDKSGQKTVIAKTISAISSWLKKILTEILSEERLYMKFATLLGTQIAKAGITTSPIGILFGIYDLATGFFEAANLFKVNANDVDLLMRFISSVMKCLMGISVGIVIDLTLEVVGAFKGCDLKCEFASFLYDKLSGLFNDQFALNLDEAQKRFEEEAAQYNAENGDDLTLDEYSDTIANRSVIKRVWSVIRHPIQAMDKALGYGKPAGAYSGYTMTDYNDDYITNDVSGGTIRSGASTNTSNNRNKSSNINNAGFGRGPVGFGYGQALSQKNAQWSSIPLGTLPNGQPSTMANGGCGPTSLAMIANDINGKMISPGDIGKMAAANGYITQGGANAALFTKGAAEMGLKPHQVTRGSELYTNIKSGVPTIVAGRGDHTNDPFTSAGHIVVASGMDSNGNIIIKDPMDGKTKSYSASSVINNATGGWSYGYGNIDIPDMYKTKKTAYDIPFGYGLISSTLNKLSNKSKLVKDITTAKKNEAKTTTNYNPPAPSKLYNAANKTKLTSRDIENKYLADPYKFCAIKKSIPPVPEQTKDLAGIGNTALYSLILSYKKSDFKLYDKYIVEGYKKYEALSWRKKVNTYGDNIFRTRYIYEYVYKKWKSSTGSNDTTITKIDYFNKSTDVCNVATIGKKNVPVSKITDAELRRLVDTVMQSADRDKYYTLRDYWRYVEIPINKKYNKYSIVIKDGETETGTNVTYKSKSVIKQHERTRLSYIYVNWGLSSSKIKDMQERVDNSEYYVNGVDMSSIAATDESLASGLLEHTREGVMNFLGSLKGENLFTKLKRLAGAISSYMTAYVNGTDPWEAIASELESDVSSDYETAEDGKTLGSTGIVDFNGSSITIPAELNVSGRQWAKKSLSERLNILAKFAQDNARSTSLPPSLTLAQAIQETSLGSAGGALSSNNMFGVMPKGKLAKYNTIGDSVVRYWDVLSGKLYSGARTATTAYDAMHAVANAGYCTSTYDYPNNIPMAKIDYENKLKRLYVNYNLGQYDSVGGKNIYGWGDIDLPIGYGNSTWGEMISGYAEGVGNAMKASKMGDLWDWINSKYSSGKSSNTNTTSKSSSSSLSGSSVGSSVNVVGNNAKEAIQKTLKYTRISSPFGYRSDPQSGKRKMHNGIDFAAPAGTPIYTPVSGTVTRSESPGSTGGFGNLVVVTDSKGTQHYFAHQSKRLVSKGARVAKGAKVGLVGSTGKSTGNHLHYGVKKNGSWINPASYSLVGLGPDYNKKLNIANVNMAKRYNINPDAPYFGGNSENGGFINKNTFINANNDGVESRLDTIANTIDKWYGDSKNSSPTNITNSGNTTIIGGNKTNNISTGSRAKSAKSLKNPNLNSMYNKIATL